jgi:uncharacterized integral membrane protein (TIGR00697 family)
MVPDAVTLFFSQHQNSLWVATVAIDLAMTLLLFRLFGKQGLYAAIVLDIMLANIQGPKLTIVFGMETSLGMIIYSGIYFATDLLGERYGRREANRAVLIGFSTSLILMVLMSISLMFAPSQREVALAAHGAIEQIFGFTPRFVLGSLFAYLISQTHDVWLFHRLKRWTQGRHLWLRNNLSTMVSQLIDTVLYSTVVWWAIFDFKTAVQLAAAKYLFKVIIAMIDTPFIYWARNWRSEDRDWSDAGEGSEK